MQTVVILTVVSVIILFSITMTIQYHCVMGFKGVTTNACMHMRCGRTLTSSIKSTLSLSLSSPQKKFHFNPRSKAVLFSTSTANGATTAFQPPEPPGTKGIPIFPDIKILNPDENDSNDNATRRNTDSNAVMVVTGANRGIGLQFVKSLLHHTKVRINAMYNCSTPIQRLRSYFNIAPYVYRVQSLLAVVHRKLQHTCMT